MVGLSYFLSGPTTIQSLQNGEKMRKSELDKIVILHPMTNFLSFSTFDFPFFFFFFVWKKISSSFHGTITLVWFGFFFFFFFFGIKFRKVGSFCLFLSFFLKNILLAFAYFINK